MTESKPHQHYKVFKPYGMLSQFSSNAKQEQKKTFLKDLGEFPNGIMPIGRLDEKSEGLLLLTTDGQLSHNINSSGIEKEYYALVDGAITELEIEQLKNGVEIGFSGKKYMTKPCKVAILNTKPTFPDRKKKIRDERHGPTTWISITLTEGKFRQVRKMTSAVGFPTLRLVRVRIGNIKLGDMGISEVIEIDSLPQII